MFIQQIEKKHWGTDVDLSTLVQEIEQQTTVLVNFRVTIFGNPSA